MSAVSTRRDLGALCHFKNGSIPVAVITDLKSNIICSNETEEGNGWFVSGCRIMITRFWASSTAYVMLSTKAEDEAIAPFPLKELGIEREVCIWLGYLPYLRPVIPEDLGTNLIRTYVGSIDIVQSTNTDQGGYTVSLQLRDRLKWTMDTIVSYNPALDKKVGEQPLRSNLILEVAQRGIGNIDGEGGCSVCGKSIVHNPDFYYDLGDFEKFGIERSEPIEPPSSPAGDRLSGGGGSAVVADLQSPEVKAVLDMIAWAEGGEYNIIVGGGTFSDYSDHPRQLVYLSSIGDSSDAAGRYQYLSTTWDGVARNLGLSDFSPANQDLGAVQLLKNRGVYNNVLNRQWDAMLESISYEWASLPPFRYGSQGGYVTRNTVIRKIEERLAFYGSNPSPQPALERLEGEKEPKQAQQLTIEEQDEINRERLRREIEEVGIENIPTEEELKEQAAKSEVPPPNVWYIGDGEVLGPLAGAVRTPNFEVSENPDFRIYTTRAPINLQQDTNFLINQQIPLEIIKYLAMQEIYPFEVFCDHRDGHIYYCPRANDASGLEDPERYHRTYFFRNYPDEYIVGASKGLNYKQETEESAEEKTSSPTTNVCPPDHNQMLLSFREEQASLDLKTNFIVSKSAPNSQGGTGDDWTIHLKVKPQVLESVEFACKFYKIYDQTITSLEEAAVVALNAARIMGKEVKAGTAVMIGDPSIVPGEIFQIFGSPLQPGLGIPNGYEDRATYTEFEGRYTENLKIYAEQSLKNAGVTGRGIKKSQSIELPVYNGSTAKLEVEEFSQASMDGLVCESKSSLEAEEGQDIKQDPPTIYRVEAIIHKMNVGNKGFTTEIALTSPF